MIFSRVLITGANGLLGQALVRSLGRYPHYDVLATGLDTSPRYPDRSGGYAQMDIRDAAEVQRVFQDFTPDVVINCAGLTQVDVCEIQRERCWEVNATSVGTLARCCRQHGTHLIQLSTDFVFDGAAGPYDEQARPRPINFYGRSKLAGENLAREAGLDRWTIVRTVLVFGAGQNLTRSNIVRWVYEKVSKGEPIKVVTDQWRTPTYNVDLADGIEKIIRLNKTGVFHLSGRELLSIYDLARRVAHLYGLDASLIAPTDGNHFRQPAHRPERTGFIILKAETELGYQPHTLRDALAALAPEFGISVSSIP